MNNQVAAPCCGSCAHWKCKGEWFCCYFQYDEKVKRLEELQAQIGDDWTENDEVYNLSNEIYDWEDTYFKESIDNCNPATPDYSPRNPIPIIELPGVKEMVEAAFREGLHYGFEEEGDYPAPLKVDRMVSKFMKTLEAK